MSGKRKGGVILALILASNLSSLSVLEGKYFLRSSSSGFWPGECLVSLFDGLKVQGLGGWPLFGRIDLSQTKAIPPPREEDILGREEIRAAVIDSGLGGLSVMAEAARRLEREKFYRQVNLVFFNALFSREKGYNALPTREARLEMLDKVLASLEKKFNPDLIIIACNTLSTLYGSTLFSHKAKIPVFDIVQPGVNLLSQELRKNPDAVALILATPITISEDTHRQALLRQRFSPNRIFVQACPELELFIEKNPEGEETGLLISGFLEEGLQKLAKPWPPVIISLNCTHYEYALPLWEKAARESGLASFSIVSPNTSLLDLWLKPGLRPRFEKTTVKATVFSRVEIEAKTRKNIAALLRKISPEVAEALLNYVLDPNLF
ncbi:MAG: hypothetical protein ACUVWQ_11290 [Candidatus Aminicenantales bacterium]